MHYCPNCGASLREDQKFCSNCGFPADAQQQQAQAQQNQSTQTNSQQYYQNNQPPYQQENAVVQSPKSRLVTLLLAVFVGSLGVHRFYVGKTGSGIAWLLTGGLFGIGTLVDIIQIALGNFTDENELPVLNWDT